MGFLVTVVYDGFSTFDHFYDYNRFTKQKYRNTFFLFCLAVLCKEIHYPLCFQRITTGGRADSPKGPFHFSIESLFYTHGCFFREEMFLTNDVPWSSILDHGWTNFFKRNLRPNNRSYEKSPGNFFVQFFMENSFFNIWSTFRQHLLPKCWLRQSIHWVINYFVFEDSDLASLGNI